MALTPMTARAAIGAVSLLLALSATPAHADVPQALGAYVRARAADAAGRSDVAVEGYRAALAASPGNALIAVRAYREAMVAGDLPLVRTSVAALKQAGIAPADVAVIDVADAIADRRWQEANAAVDRMAKGPLDFLVPSIKAWLAFERGDAGGAATLDPEAKSALERRFNLENRALIDIAAGRADAGVTALRSLVAGGTDSVTIRAAAAQLLVAQGRRDDARALLAGNDPVLVALREGLRGAKPMAAFGVSRMFVRLAGDLVDGDARPLAIVLCRAALVLDPRDDRARLTLAGALSNDGAQGRAIATVEAVDRRGPYAAAADAMAVTILSRAGDTDRALDAAERAANAKGAGADEAQRLGELLDGAGRHREAAAAYATALDRAGAAADWTLYLQRGGALEQAGQWAEAKPFLERAVALAPQEAHALNYLGYAQVERGENLAVARALLERAARLQPDDAAIADSLGWAYVRTGDLARGLPLLERAARAEPGDVTINDHLGDAYWALGRRYEARYAWRAATVYADVAERDRISAKLANGPAS
ncbi:tetratricopeptide repeat protein [Sphingomonas floccifaciens]|uniref:Tetratricopeptide repeat protein n=1 Tax=Sphingomonas floccifaciens TaxID=1844115 RepID=A0ABW4NGP0_9SPHN